ncbi:Protein strawberry notch -like protein 1 [Trichinella pseudospiralis]|uniref:Protein strawberry notch-like protein 1 n=1 Tax=Trichinella pseudospiralis TaxID=6337 RepID=A0A0V1K308_TRIPS|nr:Protein strawberry notch -like protein 1 [Trichinella pseudospiralis]
MWAHRHRAFADCLVEAVAAIEIQRKLPRVFVLCFKLMDNSEEDDLLSAAMSDAGLDVILNDSAQSYATSQTDFELLSTKNTVSQALNIPENSAVHSPGIGTSQQVPVVPNSVQLRCSSGKSVRIVVRKSASNKPTVLLQGKQLSMISKIPPNRLVLHKSSNSPRIATPTTLNTSTSTNGVNVKNTQLTSTVFKPVVSTSRNALPAQQYAQSDFVRPSQVGKFRNPNPSMPVIMRQPRMPSYQQPLQRLKNATWTTRTSNTNAANLGGDNTFSSTVQENAYYYNADETIQAEIEEADGDFEMCHANTYADYVPSKLRSGLSHPDAVVETSSLASVQPPDIWYHVSIPEEIIDHGFISALQLETIIYACQQHETFLPSGERSGYLIGDGPGVGKGRTIAGIIYENYLLGRKRSLWFSVSSDLKYDAQRDLEDVGAQKIKVHALNKYTKVSGKENGSVKKGVIFATYASLIGESQNAKSKYRTRMKQLLHWCGSRFDGVIVLDECHRAKNLCPVGSSRPSKTGQTVMELQKALPKARIVYASATGATEPRHMAYMVRLGLWGTGRAFSDFSSFISAVERRGVGAMEIIAMDMKLRGLYLARQLSFSGVSFRVEEVPLSAEFIQMYDSAVKLWLETRKQFQMVTEMLNVNSAGRKAMWGQFWASHQRFFKYLCIAAKVNACVRLARESVRNGKCVVIGLQSTGEARTLEQLGDCGGELTDFISTAKGVFQSLVEKHFPTSDRYGMSTSLLGIKRNSSTAFGRVDLSWKQNLRREKSSKRPNSDLAALSDGSDGDQSLTGLDSDDQQSDSDDSGSNSTSAANSASDEDEDDVLFDKDNDNYDNDDDDDDDDDLNDSLNPFFSDTEQDPWEMKLKRADKKSKKKKRPSHSSNSEDGDTWPDEEQTDRRVDKQGSLANHVAMSAAEFLGSGNSFLCSEYDGDNLNDTDLGITKANLMKADLLVAIERLGETLPPNTLDQLIDELGGPDYVAEMTGRKGRVVSNDEGQVQYELRHDADVPLEMLNLKEKERFMTGEKRIAIISEAASSGISLHSDRRAPNQRRRVHITLELPWSADKAIQQFGRTHRSNQINSPEYVFLISELAGEQRFASVVAKRLESLGALTHGDRRATETRDLSQFNLDTKYGRTALEVTLKSIVDMRQYLEGIGLAYCERPGGPVILDKEMNLTKFLNRILGLPVSAQNYLFQFFSDTLKEVVDQAKRDGRYDLGILDLGQKQERVRKMETKIFRNHWLPGDLKTELHKVCVERGLPWSEAMDLHCMNMGEDDGFYISTNPRLKPSVIFICAVRKKRYDYYDDSQMYNIFKPYSCLNSKQENLSVIKQKYKKVSPAEAEKIWQEIYESSGTQCQHIYWYIFLFLNLHLYGKCRNVMAGLSCEVGKRTRFLHILSGSVFAVWNLVESVLNVVQHRQQNRMQIVRLRTEANQKLVGLLIPNACVDLLIQRLQSDQTTPVSST